MSLKLSVPADLRFLAIVQGFVRELAVAAGVPSDEALLLEVASEEAFVNILKHAYPGCNPGDIHIEGMLGESELDISFRDEGIPFGTLPEHCLESFQEDGTVPESGLGFRLIRNAADEVRFENLGRRGKALRLIKRLTGAVWTGPAPEVNEIPPAPEQKYEIRPMLSDEASQIPRPQRESYVHCFQYLSPPPEVTAHLPLRHRAMVDRIYENLKQQCRMGEPAPASFPGDFRIHFDSGLQKGVITVTTSDERQWPEILRVVQDLEEMAGAEVVNIDLPLAQPATALLFERAEEAGFVFTGIRPCQLPDGDNARLQRLRVPFDMGRLRIYPGFGDELLEYVTTALSATGK